MFFFARGWVRRVITCLYIFGGNCFSLAILCPVSPRCILKVPTQMSVILELHSCLQARRRLFVPRTTSKTRYFSSKRGRAKEPPHLHPSYCRASFLNVPFGLLVRGLYVRPRLSRRAALSVFSAPVLIPLTNALPVASAVQVYLF